MFIGILLLILGVLMLLDKLGIIYYGNAWDYFFPAALIALGVSFIMRDKKHTR